MWVALLNTVRNLELYCIKLHNPNYSGGQTFKLIYKYMHKLDMNIILSHFFIKDMN